MHWLVSIVNEHAQVVAAPWQLSATRFVASLNMLGQTSHHTQRGAVAKGRRCACLTQSQLHAAMFVRTYMRTAQPTDTSTTQIPLTSLPGSCCCIQRCCIAQAARRRAQEPVSREQAGHHGRSCRRGGCMRYRELEISEGQPVAAGSLGKGHHCMHAS